MACVSFCLACCCAASGHMTDVWCAVTLPFAIRYHASPFATVRHRSLPCVTIRYRASPFAVVRRHSLSCVTIRYRASPFATVRHHSLPCVTIRYRVSPFVTVRYRASPFATVHHHSLPCVTTRYRASPLATVHHHSLPCVTTRYRASPLVTVRHHSLPCVTIRYRVPCVTIQYRASPFSTVRHHSVPCVTIRYRASPFVTVRYRAASFHLRSVTDRPARTAAPALSAAVHSLCSAPQCVHYAQRRPHGLRCRRISGFGREGVAREFPRYSAAPLSGGWCRAARGQLRGASRGGDGDRLVGMDWDRLLAREKLMATIVREWRDLPPEKNDAKLQARKPQ
eukprot:1179657-Prorocentrum_minimum.AAC.7